jgi:nickel/cobalt transporter (NicO) family protein
VSATTPALLIAAAGVGFGHAVLPDHWVPLAVLGRTRRYPPSRVARLSGLAGVTHVLVSIVLGAVVVAIGLQFRAQIKGAEDTIVGLILLATAAGFTIAELTGHGHHGHEHDHSHGHAHADPGADEHEHGADAHEHDHEHDHDHDRDAAAGGRLSGLAAVIVPFGAAASPDLTILPVFLAATAAGAAAAIASVLIFAGVTVATIVSLTLIAYFGGFQIRGEWLERWGNVITALALAVIGALVLTGVL